MDGDRMVKKAVCVKRGYPSVEETILLGSHKLHMSDEAPVMGVEQRKVRKVDE